MKKEINKIAIIGAGNLGWNLALNLNIAGFRILQIISKTLNSAKSLAAKVKSDFTTDINYITKEADLYIIAVPDHEINVVIKSISWQDKLVIHTSGSTPITIFDKHANNFGVIYPLQTFTKGKLIDVRNIPFLIEANNTINEKRLIDFASVISMDVQVASSEKRLIFHLSAIVTNNFINYLFSLAEELLENNNIPFTILDTLINETVKKAKELGPQKSQTGPAKRNDIKVIEKHLELLKENKDFYNIYKLLSDNIRKRYN